MLPELEDEFRKRTRDEWLEILGEGDVPASAIYDLREAIQSAQAQHNDLIQWVVNPDNDEERAGTVRSPIRNGAWPAAKRELTRWAAAPRRRCDHPSSLPRKAS